MHVHATPEVRTVMFPVESTTSTSSARLAGRGELLRASSRSLKANCRRRMGGDEEWLKGSSMLPATASIIANACSVSRTSSGAIVWNNRGVMDHAKPASVQSWY